MAEEFNLPKIEEKFLEYWRKNGIFEKTLRRGSGQALRRFDGAHRRQAPAADKAMAGKQGRKHFVFFEGPPYANGKPGIHHVLARIYKDIILRYKTMRGFYVPRRAGWDTHGLPVEMATEKALGLKSKKDIEKYGIEKFNNKAKEQVWIYKDEWEKMTERIGYWLDLKNAYVTYTAEYIETLWWTIAEIWKRKLLYKGQKVVPWCTRCGTALSSHELALGYKETEDNSVYVKFKLTDMAVADLQKLTSGHRMSRKTSDVQKIGAPVYILSWTTTPWTLPGNVALAVGGKIAYAIFRDKRQEAPSRFAAGRASDKNLYVAALNRTEAVMGEGNYEIVAKVQGKELAGLEYEPLFDVRPLHSKNSYKIYSADFVSTDEGTGVVHTAVMYGEDDYKLGQKVGLPQRHTVDEEGKFTKDVLGFVGMYVKSPKTEKKILNHLTASHYLLTTKPHFHDYPYCWRCDTPVIYYARHSWFIAMSKLRRKLLAENEKINWVPAHLKDGRFGEWLKEAKDWNLSRERYWGTPLPIWECGECPNVEVIGSLDELSKKALRRGSGQALRRGSRQTGGSENEYWVIRHGEAENNVRNVVDAGEGKYRLTPSGKEQAGAAAGKLNGKKINIIFASDVLRTKETAEIVAETLGVKKITYDKRLREILLGELAGCHDDKYHEMFPTYRSKFEGAPRGGETLRDLSKRMWEFLRDCEKKYSGKNILIVSHEYPIWLLFHAAAGWTEKRSIAEKERRGGDFIAFASPEKLPFRVVPRNPEGEVDLHRPYADEIKIKCGKCSSTRSGQASEMRRVKEVADVWYDSGAMPLAQAHYPFACAKNPKSNLPAESSAQAGIQNPKQSLNSCLDYPADYIAEGMDQTRGWFYTLLAVATALGRPSPYKNVVSLGLINDKFGQKMSKSKGNVVEPWDVINKYGADAVRWYFYTVNPPGETKNFDEAEVAKIYRKMHLILYNSFVFYKTYAGKAVSGKKPKSKDILDRWILARLDEVAAGMTKKLDAYEIRDGALLMETFIDDLSRWYIRRSRRRLSSLARGRDGGESEDHKNAASTLGYALLEAAKLIAPFVPFFAESLYRELVGGGAKESVHLERWPLGAARGRPKTRNKKQATSDKKLLEQMEGVRRLASEALAKRAEAGIKVRQPLRELRIKNKGLSKRGELLTILADEINVKRVVYDKKLVDEVELDVKITPELKEEGTLRELVRAVQSLRQKAGLRPKDVIVVALEANEPLRDAVLRNEEQLKKDVGAKTVEYKKGKFDVEISTKVDEQEIWLAVRKI